MTTAITARRSVIGYDVPISSPTEVPLNVSPQSPVNRLPRYLKYCTKMLSSRLNFSVIWAM